MNTGWGQVILAVCAMLTGGFSMLKYKFALDRRRIDYNHSQHQKIVDQNHAIAETWIKENKEQLLRFEMNVKDLFSQVDSIKKEINWFRTIIPKTNDLLEKVHAHFEKRIPSTAQKPEGPATEVVNHGPEVRIVKDKPKKE